jgi:FkbM family methyltransferase
MHYNYTTKFIKVKDRFFPNGYPDEMIAIIEPKVENVVQKIKTRFNLDEIKTMLDVGSFTGIESVMFTDRLPNVFIHAFEPNPESLINVLICTENVDRIKVHELAMSNFIGESTFFVTNDNIGASSLLKPSILLKTGPVSNEIKVRVNTIENWANENNIDTIDFIWMDVQGSELNVLMGMGELLKKLKGVYVESAIIPYYHGGAHRDDVINYLSSFGLELIESEYHD